MFIFILESLLFTATTTIMILTAWFTIPQQLAICILGILAMCSLCWRLISWRWIGISHQRFWRIGPTTVLGNSIWAGGILAASPYGFLGKETLSWAPRIYQYEVREFYLRGYETNKIIRLSLIHLQCWCLVFRSSSR